MRSVPPLAVLAVVATALTFAVAASLGGRGADGSAWWPSVLLLGLGGLSALGGVVALQRSGRFAWPATSRALHESLREARVRTESHPEAREAVRRALSHALYGEHDEAQAALGTVPFQDGPELAILRGQTLAVLGYLRGEQLDEALGQARRALRLVRRERRESDAASELYVAWGEVLTGELPEGELPVLEAALTHDDPLVVAMARAALVRALAAFGRADQARAVREELEAACPEALGLLAHADFGSTASGVRVKTREGKRAAG